MSKEKKGFLLLKDGSLYKGHNFGNEETVFGEVVFNTSLIGYQEALTDPNYFGQIMVQTFPLVGNYGVNNEDYESLKCHLSGYIVREWCEIPSNFRSEGNISEFLKRKKVTALCGIDTRSLTKKIRESGTMAGMISCGEFDVSKKEEWLEELKNFEINRAVESVSCSEIETFEAENEKYRVVLYDFGYKRSLLNEFLKRGCSVTAVPYNYKAEEVMALKPDGILLSNGPGNPKDNTAAIENLKKLRKCDIPVFGVCLGHQLFALANGAKTEKLKYGHRGGNQPVMTCGDNKSRVYITNQNHDYTVISDSIPVETGETIYKNVNDGTCEGIRYKNKKSLTVQFYPKDCGGLMDTSYIYDEFISGFKK